MSGIMLCDDLLEMIGEYHLLNIHKKKMSSVRGDIEYGGSHPNTGTGPHRLKTVWVLRRAGRYVLGAGRGRCGI
jgi:hypothetical protein